MIENSLFKYAFKKQVIETAVKVSLLVGTLLAFINHYQAFVDLAELENRLFPILLTYLVPYSVSTYSSVKILKSKELGEAVVHSLYEKEKM